MPKGTAAALLALLLVAAGLTGCGNPARPGLNLGSSIGTSSSSYAATSSGYTAGSNSNAAGSKAGKAPAGLAAGTAGKVSHWKLEDLSRAEGRKLFAETYYGDTTVTADLTGQEQALLDRLLQLPPGSALKDADLANDHLKRVQQQGEFVYGLDGRFHRAIWRFQDAAGKTLGYRVHSQPKDLLSGKYIIAFYGADTRLLMAQPVWY